MIASIPAQDMHPSSRTSNSAKSRLASAVAAESAGIEIEIEIETGVGVGVAAETGSIVIANNQRKRRVVEWTHLLELEEELSSETSFSLALER
jgi:Tfp pilus assembly major pilin PilA